MTIDLERANLIDQGLCAIYPHGWWMPDDIEERGKTNRIYETYDPELEETAKEICGNCDVQAECLAWALQPRRIVIGIWGGKTLTERRRIRKGPTYARTYCLECGRERMLKFFPNDGLKVCEDCRIQTLRVCRVDDCGRQDIQAHGLCNLHYVRFNRHGTTDTMNGKASGGGRPRRVPKDSVMLEAFRAGVSNQALAASWGVTASTVRTHRSRLLKGHAT